MGQNIAQSQYPQSGEYTAGVTLHFSTPNRLDQSFPQFEIIYYEGKKGSTIGVENELEVLTGI